ncbi:MAG: Txe/YoeB family addiction module toxin [Deltaproteobacteria bacterium]|jgi:toxin YoeB|nr:Txe/YoeB family addiction module toxin [Deltaproteobacteria bacterium]
MNLELTDQAKEDIAYWNRQNNDIAERIFRLIENTLETPFSGLGKPEPLKHSLQGYWSRRINSEHRLVYKFDKETLTIVSCRFHYR